MMGVYIAWAAALTFFLCNKLSTQAWILQFAIIHTIKLHYCYDHTVVNAIVT